MKSVIDVIRKTTIVATFVVATSVAFAQSTPPHPPSPTAQAQAQQVRPSEADYMKAQMQTLLGTVQSLTPQLVEARAQVSALEAKVADLEHQLADATKSSPAKPADFDKPAAPPSPATAPASNAK